MSEPWAGAELAAGLSPLPDPAGLRGQFRAAGERAGSGAGPGCGGRTGRGTGVPQTRPRRGSGPMYWGRAEVALIARRRGLVG